MGGSRADVLVLGDFNSAIPKKLVRDREGGVFPANR